MTLSPRSFKCLEGVHPDLVKVVKRADAMGARFHITCGVRTLEEQRRLVKAGKSRTLKSRHLTGHAVDFVVAEPGGGVSYEMADMTACAAIFKDAARAEGVAIEWGGDWRSFVDTPHIELDRRMYKADGTKPNSVTELPNSGSVNPNSVSPVVITLPVKPVYKHRTLWNLGIGGSFLTWFGDLFSSGLHVITEAGTQFAALGTSRELLATVGGNSKTIAIGLGVGCLISAACNKLGDSVPAEPQKDLEA